MTDVQRFTTDYIPVEDRIRLSVELREGSVQIFWLTRPLLNKLVARLIKAVDAARLPGASSNQPKKGAGAARQRFNQQAAEASLKQQRPVRADTSAKQAGIPMLVTSISLRDGQGGLVLDFKGGERVLQSIPFSGEAVRQWLSVLHKNYCRAGWGGDFWPAWITTDQPPINTARLN